MRVRAVVEWVLLAGIAAGAGAGQGTGQAAKPSPNQEPEPSQSRPQSESQKQTQSPYTLQVNTRVVLTDVTVTDKHGNPVRGLTEEDFRIFDNGKPQTLASFDEHHEKMARLEETAAGRDAGGGSFSNEFLRHPPPQVNVLLFDTTTIGMIDQMVLFQQMEKFVDQLPTGEPVAVFARSGEVTLQLSGIHGRPCRAAAGDRAGDSTFPAAGRVDGERHGHAAADGDVSEPGAGAKESALVHERIESVPEHGSDGEPGDERGAERGGECSAAS